MTARSIVHRAELAREQIHDKPYVVVLFDDLWVRSVPYRKSWSLRKYVAVAAQELGLTLGWDMSYGWHR